MKKLIATIWCAVSFIGVVFAQESLPQQFFIREIAVKPAMSGQYGAAVKKLKEACALHKVNVAWTTVINDDNTFTHLFPISGLAALEKPIFSELQTKMGNEAFGSLWPDLYKCTDGHTTVVSTLLPSLSYLNTVEGENHVEVLFLTPLPGKNAELEAVFAEWKKTYIARKVPVGYQLFKTMFGEDPGYVIVLSAKNPADMVAKNAKTSELAGAEIGNLWQKQVSLCKKYQWKRGNIVPELSYQFVTAN